MRHLFSTFDVSRQGEPRPSVPSRTRTLTGVFHTTRLSLAIVNLKPLLPGHVLVLPRRVVPRLDDLNADEVCDLFLAVQSVGRVVERAYGAEALTVSVQDGVAAGQSVPHVHVHVLPRFRTDFGGKNDEVYPKLERSEQELRGDLDGVNGAGASASSDKAGRQRADPGAEMTDKVGSAEGGVPAAGRGWEVPKDEDRRPRGMEEMEAEAKWLAEFFT